MDRLKRFQVSSAQNETLNWAFGIYLLVVILGFVDNWLGRPAESAESLVQVFASAQNERVMLIVEQLLTGCGELLMLEIFRRCLHRENQYFIHLAAVVLMVLMALGMIIHCLPNGATIDENGLHETAWSLFQTRFYTYNHYAMLLVKLFLGIALALRYGGRIRLYGLSLFIVPLFMMLCSFAYFYAYTEIGGLTMDDINTLNSFLSIVNLILMPLPVVLLRLSMSTDS